MPNGNLSDTTAGSTLGDAGTGDTAGNRTFSVDSTGAITYPATGCDSTSGAHATGTQPNTGKLIVQLIPYDDTANPGGVYVAAVCKVGAASPSDCKYDAFRIKVTTPGQPSQGTVTVCKFWDQNLDHIWDNNEPFMGAWPINATISGGDTAATLDTTSKDTDNTVGQDGTPGLGFGCATFTVTCRPATHPPRR